MHKWLPSIVLVAFASIAIADNQKTPVANPLPSETPAKFVPVKDSFDYVRREVMIPMRDGVKLQAVIIIPKGVKNAPILLTRTPYNAKALSTHSESSHLGPTLYGYDNAVDVIQEGGFIRVLQDIRGKYNSEGDYVLGRPLVGPLNSTKVDHATDTYDTIDWLVKNIPESNGKVGILGISYDGLLSLMALVNPHPALKVAVPMNPLVDGWMGDDWFHNGAFRQQMMPYIYEQVGTRKNEELWWTNNYDDYDVYLRAGSAGELGRRYGLEQIGFWNKILAHPAYDSFWQQQALDKILATQPIKIPVMLVHSLWDQEDIYGDIAVYNALKQKADAKDKLFLVMGPWYHGQEIRDGSSIGKVKFDSDTALYFRKNILHPFLDQYLKDNAPKANVSAISAFETGTNTWQHLSELPTTKTTPLYLTSGMLASFDVPKSKKTPYDEYISDPAKPVPFRSRPIRPVGHDPLRGLTWPEWLLDDQREASGRTDVLSYVSTVLTSPVKISGQPMANLIASTSGTDSDWVVKVIDVYPDEVGSRPEMGGYQLMISADIFRGRYRESLEKPKAIAANKPQLYRFALPTANHVFLPGHRIMVQIQSSWFPLYDRNPQTFVPSIFWAKAGDYKKAVQRIYHAPNQVSFIELPVVPVTITTSRL
ncbi:MAG: CocE/NonD family hydrolase [Gammaproteobacteria bacterium]|nr:CocE/NonD family hydrolase [Gammaproteobacteria bacterium]